MARATLLATKKSPAEGGNGDGVHVPVTAEKIKPRVPLSSPSRCPFCKNGVGNTLGFSVCVHVPRSGEKPNSCPPQKPIATPPPIPAPLPGGGDGRSCHWPV